MTEGISFLQLCVWLVGHMSYLLEHEPSLMGFVQHSFVLTPSSRCKGSSHFEKHIELNYVDIYWGVDFFKIFGYSTEVKEVEGG